MKPLLILHEEKFVVSGVARTRDKAIQRLYDFVTALSQAGKIAVSYSTDEDDAETLAKRIRKEFPDAPLYLTRIGPVLGTTRGGPRGDGGGGQRGVTNDGKAQVFRD